jgi:N-acyl-D-amino-acid deacylase
MPRTSFGEMTRRRLLAAGVIVVPTLAASNARSVAEVLDDPFHDPSYSLIRPRSELVSRLSSRAREAQETPRHVRGISITGLPEAVPELDDAIVDIMAASGIPGVSVALARNNELVVARGYGRASIVGDIPVEPTMPATIMSVSKAITVIAALAMVRDKKLRLDDLVFPLLQDNPLLALPQSVDPRQYKIQVRHLMSHTSGLFNNVEGLNDPALFQMLARRGAIRLVHGRTCQNDLVRLGMKESLLFEPGQRYAYSGQGIQVLGRIVEKVSGQRLDHYIQKEIFQSLGVRSYYVGSYLDDDQYRELMRPNRERLYAMSPTPFDKDGNHNKPRDVTNVGYVSWGQADACGWGSLNSIDLLRFVSAVPAIAGPELWGQITERPLVIDDAGQRVPAPMGLGWVITEKGGNKGIYHNGLWPGERSFAGLRPDGGSFAILVNSDRPPYIGQIVATVGRILSRPEALHFRSLGWQDYGYPG